MPNDGISDHVKSYEMEQPKYRQVREEVDEILKAEFEKEEISVIYESRVKKPESLEKKLRKRAAERKDNGSYLDGQVEELWDKVGGRISLKQANDRKKVEAILLTTFELQTLRPIEHDGPNYKATHYQLKRKCRSRDDVLPNMVFEIQLVEVAKLLSNYWNHLIEYKGSPGHPNHGVLVALSDTMKKFAEANNSLTHVVEYFFRKGTLEGFPIGNLADFLSNMPDRGAPEHLQSAGPEGMWDNRSNPANSSRCHSNVSGPSNKCTNNLGQPSDQDIPQLGMESIIPRQFLKTENRRLADPLWLREILNTANSADEDLAHNGLEKIDEKLAIRHLTSASKKYNELHNKIKRYEDLHHTELPNIVYSRLFTGKAACALAHSKRSADPASKKEHLEKAKRNIERSLSLPKSPSEEAKAKKVEGAIKKEGKAVGRLVNEAKMFWGERSLKAGKRLLEESLSNIKVA